MSENKGIIKKDMSQIAKKSSICASIKGFSLGKIKRFKGHEGEPCVQGDILYNGKKVGYYSDSFMMGPSDIDFDNNEINELAKKASTAYYTENPERWTIKEIEPDIELLFYEIKNFIEYEREFNKYIKKGYNCIAFYKETKSRFSYIGAFADIANAEKLKTDPKYVEVKVFSDKSQFIIN